MHSIPDRMKHLPVDRRGYAIPVIVLVTSDGRPHFTVNDHEKVERAGRSFCCGICGKRLWKESAWFVGGPMSAFAANGAYLDGPVHHECGTFALQTCPYLAAPTYARRIDDRTIKPGTLGDAVVLEDPTSIPERPELFVFAKAKRYAMHRNPNSMLVFVPHKPWLEYEFWEKGRKLTEAEALPLVQANFRRHGG